MENTISANKKEREKDMEEKVMDMAIINRDKFKEYVVEIVGEEASEAASAVDDPKFALLIISISMRFARRLEKRIFGDDSTD
jgi:hypothetical protein